MNLPLSFTAAADPGSAASVYVILTGAVCTALGWWLRGRIGAPPARPAPEQDRNEKEAPPPEPPAAPSVAIPEPAPPAADPKLEAALASALAETASLRAALAARPVADTTTSAPESARRITELESELAEARRRESAAEPLRAELLAARNEIRLLKAGSPGPKPRPILTSPRPEPGRPAGTP